MLIEEFYYLLEDDDEGLVVSWIRSVSPDRRPEPPRIQNQHLVFPFASGGQLAWNDLQLLQKLRTTNPRYAVPLLWELAIRYDEYYESSKALRNYCKDQIEVALEPAAFHRDRQFLKVTVWGKAPPKSVEGVEVSVDNNRLAVTLWPTVGVRDTLVDHLGEAALGIASGYLQELLGVNKCPSKFRQ
jgi:hypothetical protein